MECTVAIIGFGTAGAAAAAQLRASGFAGRIDVFTAGPALPYSPVAGSYYAAGQLDECACFTASEELVAALDLTMHGLCPVTALDAAAHTLATPQGIFGYSYCVIASGASPVAYAGPGAGQLAPLYLRTFDDARALGALLEGGNARVLISGSSLVALKAAEACLARGAQTTLLGRSEHILRTVAFPQVAARFEESLAAQGMKLRLGQGIAALSSINGAAAQVTFSTGETEGFDAVLVAHGVRPNLQFVDHAVLKDGALEVDAYQQTKLDGVFAAGDVALVADVQGGPVRPAGLFKDCVDQARVAACRIAALATGLPGQTSPTYPGVLRNNIVSVGDAELVTAGNPTHAEAARLEVYAQGGSEVTVARDGAGRVVAFNVFSAEAGAKLATLTIGEQLLRQLKATLYG